MKSYKNKHYFQENIYYEGEEEKVEIFIWNRSQSLKNCFAVQAHSSLLAETFPFEKGQDKCYSSLFNMLINIDVNVLLVLIFYTFFYFGLYIFILPLLIPKLIKT